MASKTSKKELSEFARRAMQRMEDKQTGKHQELYVPSVDSNIVIRNLDKAEVAECMAVEDNGDPTAQINTPFIWPSPRFSPQTPMTRMSWSGGARMPPA